VLPGARSQLDEVADRLRGVVREQVQPDLPEVGVQGGGGSQGDSFVVTYEYRQILPCARFAGTAPCKRGGYRGGRTPPRGDQRRRCGVFKQQQQQMSHTRMIREELGQSLEHAKRAANHAASGIGEMMGPRMTPMAERMRAGTRRKDNGGRGRMMSGRMM